MKGDCSLLQRFSTGLLNRWLGRGGQTSLAGILERKVEITESVHHHAHEVQCVGLAGPCGKDALAE